MAVTTCLPLAMACRIRVLAMPSPPIISMTMSTSGSLTTRSASSISTPSARRTPRSVVRSMSATYLRFRPIPSRSRMRSALSINNRATPAPTVPNPSNPTCSVVIPLTPLYRATVAFMRPEYVVGLVVMINRYALHAGPEAAWIRFATFVRKVIRTSNGPPLPNLPLWGNPPVHFPGVTVYFMTLRMPRTAWPMRMLFSIRAKRT